MCETSLNSERPKIVFFSHGDDNFIIDIIEELSIQYETKKVTLNGDMNLIDQWMKWADICWFEWCDELLIYGCKLAMAKEKKIICRLHSYEAFTYYPSQVNWGCVDRLIFVSEDIQNYVIEHYKVNKEITMVIPNGVDLGKWTFKQRNSGFNVAYVGYINYKKGPMLLLHTIKAIFDWDNRYKFYIAGQFQDPRYSLYFKQMVKEFGLEDNFFFEGWQQDLDKWLEDKNFVLCTSVLESQNMSVMQAMAKGIKPIVHNFVGAQSIYDKKYLWNTIDEAVCLITEESYNSQEYRDYISDNYSFEIQFKEIKTMMDELIIKNKQDNHNSFDYKDYWNQRLNSKFDIEGVGYIGLGTLYNQFMYQNRMDLLQGVINKTFDEISNKRVLELGPGTGIFTEYFYKKEVKSYDAIDITTKSVFELRHRYPNYHFKQGDICEGSQYEGEYDLIFGADVLLHVTNDAQYKKAINNISKHLNNNGICILLDPISIVSAESESPHVIIRDKGYVEKILRNDGLELVEMLPVAYFMNYPFDREIIGSKGSKALCVFNLIQELFTNNSIINEDKKIIGEYLLYRERRLLINKDFGLSEKLLIIQKQESRQCTSYNLKEIFDINSIKNNIRTINGKLITNEILKYDQLKQINTLLDCLEEDEDIYAAYLQKRMNEFISYDIEDFDNYDFSTAQIMLGKREKTEVNYEIIEFILNNHQNIKLIFNNIWYDISKDVFILPEQMKKSKKSMEIIYLAKEILGNNLEFQNNIAGFIFDQAMKEDVSRNYLAYIWERGIPASQFLPILGYLRIVERYIFSSNFINIEQKVLEAPCGFGYGAAYLSRLCKQVEALDIADDNIVFAKEAFRHQNIHWAKGDVIRLPYADNEFDVYVSYEVFEHLSVETALKHIEEAYRVIKETGKFIISTPNRDMRKQVNNPFHIKEYDFEEFNSILKKVFHTVDFYSMSDSRVEKGMKQTAFDMIAVCEK